MNKNFIDIVFIIVLVLLTTNLKSQPSINNKSELIQSLVKITLKSDLNGYLSKYSNDGIPGLINENSIFINTDFALLEGIRKYEVQIDSNSIYFLDIENLYFFDIIYYVIINKFTVNDKDIFIDLFVINSASRYCDLPFIYCKNILNRRKHDIKKQEIRLLTREGYNETIDSLQQP